jgi:hypothetical protein
MRAVIGIDRKIKRAWLDAVLDQMARASGPSDLRAFLDQRLRVDLAGPESRRKAIGILLKIWLVRRAQHMSIRNRGLSLSSSIARQEWIWLHWGMAALAYPFFRDCVEVVGRLLSLQDDFTTAQLQERLIRRWGDRATTREAAHKVVHTLVDWDVIRSTETKGRFLIVARMRSASPALQLWLLESLLAASSAAEIEAQQLLRLPEMFPFQLSIGIADVRRHDRFDVHRQGLDMDMVAVRPISMPAVQKPSKPRAAIGRRQSRPGLFQDTAEEQFRAPSDTGTSETVAVAASVHIDEPRETAEGKAQPVPANTRANATAEFAPVESETGEQMTRRRRLSANLDLPIEVPFSRPIRECARLFQDGHDFACIALGHELIIAILRLVCRVKLGVPHSKAPDIRSQFAGLTAVGALPILLKTSLEQVWYERSEYLSQNVGAARNRSKLEAAAESHIKLLVELSARFFRYTTVGAKIVPEHPEYWTSGRRSPPIKADAAG